MLGQKETLYPLWCQGSAFREIDGAGARARARQEPRPHVTPRAWDETQESWVCPPALISTPASWCWGATQESWLPAPSAAPSSSQSCPGTQESCLDAGWKEGPAPGREEQGSRGLARTGAVALAGRLALRAAWQLPLSGSCDWVGARRPLAGFPRAGLGGEMKPSCKVPCASCSWQHPHAGEGDGSSCGASCSEGLEPAWHLQTVPLGTAGSCLLPHHPNRHTPIKRQP